MTSLLSFARLINGSQEKERRKEDKRKKWYEYRRTQERLSDGLEIMRNEERERELSSGLIPMDMVEGGRREMVGVSHFIPHPPLYPTTAPSLPSL